MHRPQNWCVVDVGVRGPQETAFVVDTGGELEGLGTCLVLCDDTPRPVLALAEPPPCPAPVERLQVLLARVAPGGKGADIPTVLLFWEAVEEASQSEPSLAEPALAWHSASRFVPGADPQALARAAIEAAGREATEVEDPEAAAKARAQTEACLDHLRMICNGLKIRGTILEHAEYLVRGGLKLREFQRKSINAMASGALLLSLSLLQRPRTTTQAQICTFGAITEIAVRQISTRLSEIKDQLLPPDCEVMRTWGMQQQQQQLREKEQNERQGNNGTPNFLPPQQEQQQQHQQQQQPQQTQLPPPPQPPSTLHNFTATTQRKPQQAATTTATPRAQTVFSFRVPGQIGSTPLSFTIDKAMSSGPILLPTHSTKPIQQNIDNKPESQDTTEGLACTEEFL